MFITMEQGNKLVVRFRDTDGEIVINWSETALSVEADLPDDDGREGIIYKETWRPSPSDIVDANDDVLCNGCTWWRWKSAPGPTLSAACCCKDSPYYGDETDENFTCDFSCCEVNPKNCPKINPSP